MKLYANTQPEHELLNYLGQDAWVRCLYQNVPVYVRVQAKSPRYSENHPYCLVCILRHEDELLLLTATHDTAMAILSDYGTMCILELKVIHPLKVKPTSYFYTEYAPNLGQFDRYMGKDIWVLAKRYSGYEYYVLPISRSGNQLICNWILSDYLTGDYWELSEYEVARIHDEIDTGAEKYSSVDSWEICQPLDVLTSEEILEMIDFHNPEVQTQDEDEED